MQGHEADNGNLRGRFVWGEWGEVAVNRTRPEVAESIEHHLFNWLFPVSAAQPTEGSLAETGSPPRALLGPVLKKVVALASWIESELELLESGRCVGRMPHQRGPKWLCVLSPPHPPPPKKKGGLRGSQNYRRRPIALSL